MTDEMDRKRTMHFPIQGSVDDCELVDFMANI